MRILTRSFFRFSSQSQTQSKPIQYKYARDIPESVPKTHMNLFQAVNSAIDIALETDHTYQSPSIIEPKFLEKMLNLVVSSGALAD